MLRTCVCVGVRACVCVCVRACVCVGGCVCLGSTPVCHLNLISIIHGCLTAVILPEDHPCWREEDCSTGAPLILSTFYILSPTSSFISSFALLFCNTCITLFPLQPSTHNWLKMETAHCTVKTSRSLLQCANIDFWLHSVFWVPQGECKRALYTVAKLS